DLCAIESHLPCEKWIYQERQAINKKMAQLIPISNIDIITKSFS
ncbi:7891_t:CDS:2, partial [Dentiscutata heterogama]